VTPAAVSETYYNGSRAILARPVDVLLPGRDPLPRAGNVAGQLPMIGIVILRNGDSLLSLWLFTIFFLRR
jgi:hypothetical protein